MNANELRIGNLVYRNDIANGSDRIETVVELNSKAVVSGPIKVICSYSELRPIPLTEEWLLKLGFENNRISVNSVDELAYMFDGDEWSLRYQTKGSGFTRDYGIKHVHQLQNLHFALTGQELCVTQP